MSKQIEMLHSQYKIEEEETKDTLLSILSDKYCRAIIEATMDKPKSAIELTGETKIPISTIYRRLQILHDNRILQPSGTISDDGKKLFMYKSRIRGMQSNYDNGKVDVKLLFN